MESKGHSGEAATMISNDAVEGRNGNDCNVKFVWEGL